MRASPAQSLWPFLAFGALLLLAFPASATPTFESARCVFPVPRGERATCGFVAVPAHREGMRGRDIRLYVAVLHSQAPSPLPDPVIFLNGGPGDAAFGEDADTWWQASRPIRAARDFIVFDQRGVGQSRPSLDCPELDRIADRNWKPGLSRAEILAMERPAAAACHDRLTRGGIDLSAYTTAEAAADVDDIAAALNYESYNLIGVSYGSRVALAVMRDFPDRVRSTVLDSVYPPGIFDLDTQPALIARVFRRLFEDCKADTDCETEYPLLGPRFDGMLAQLRAAPETIRHGRKSIRVDDGIVLDALYAAFYDPTTLADLPGLTDKVARGDLAALTPWIGPVFSGGPNRAEGLALSVACSESWPFATRDALAASVAAAEPYGGDAAYALEWQSCESWHVPPISAVDAVAVSSTVPTLLLTGSFDPITPPEYAYIAAQTLTNGRVIEFRAGSHSLLTTEACAPQLVARFIEAPTAPLDEFCPNRTLGPRFTTAGLADQPPSAAAATTEARSP
ncbi:MULTISPECIES: alpha/beta fold hydrolase [Inquilinus]|uniref:Pimeloyl-ACP methyl ester carboxylesterase n=1 Tax=Inquilinus ginsengisoli TaxID=363840 RepID=A0ABU1JZM0_9PROT|nr:alpha/beta fold hydrolase [Inquilinus ginsengisoli]MDR6293010.1 pimeloyl-ACP methyl ester carboxylesterase [Inquilinus ginsengisoli]